MQDTNERLSLLAEIIYLREKLKFNENMNICLSSIIANTKEKE